MQTRFRVPIDIDAYVRHIDAYVRHIDAYVRNIEDVRGVELDEEQKTRDEHSRRVCL